MSGSSPKNFYSEQAGSFGARMETGLGHSIAIVGAGWYGCHIASTLMNLGFDITVFDQSNRVFDGASGNNQFRLHVGFHYPRHYRTRAQSRDGFLRFIERYPSLSREIPENIYAVPTRESHIDFQTYKLIMTASGINYREVDPSPIPIRGVDGVLLTPERVLCIEKARRYFKGKLGSNLHLGERVTEVKQTSNGVIVNGRHFDVLVDTTWGHLTRPKIDVFYEPTLLLYYETDTDHPAVTFVDGPLCSVYPTEDKRIYTLSSVTHTPMGNFSNAEDARAFCRNISTDLIQQKIDLMEDQISYFLPHFRETFRYVGPQISIKTKPIGSYDDRSCYVFEDKNIVNIMSGKIDTIFVASDRLLAYLETLFEVGDAADDAQIDFLSTAPVI